MARRFSDHDAYRHLHLPPGVRLYANGNIQFRKRDHNCESAKVYYQWRRWAQKEVTQKRDAERKRRKAAGLRVEPSEKHGLRSRAAVERRRERNHQDLEQKILRRAAAERRAAADATAGVTRRDGSEMSAATQQQPQQQHVDVQQRHVDERRAACDERQATSGASINDGETHVAQRERHGSRADDSYPLSPQTLECLLQMAELEQELEQEEKKRFLIELLKNAFQWSGKKPDSTKTISQLCNSQSRKFCEDVEDFIAGFPETFSIHHGTGDPGQPGTKSVTLVQVLSFRVAIVRDLESYENRDISYKLITEVEDCRVYVDLLLKESHVGFDAENYSYNDGNSWLRGYSKVKDRGVRLLQVFSPSVNCVYLFWLSHDCKRLKDLLNDGNLRQLLETRRVVKYVVGTDDELLYQRHGIRCRAMVNLQCLASAVVRDIIPSLSDTCKFGSNLMAVTCQLPGPQFAHISDIITLHKRKKAETSMMFDSGLKDRNDYATDRLQYAAYDAYAAYFIGRQLESLKRESPSS
jgi:hypothetical protein